MEKLRELKKLLSEVVDELQSASNEVYGFEKRKNSLKSEYDELQKKVSVIKQEIEKERQSQIEALDARDRESKEMKSAAEGFLSRARSQESEANRLKLEYETLLKANKEKSEELDRLISEKKSQLEKAKALQETLS